MCPHEALSNSQRTNNDPTEPQLLLQPCAEAPVSDNPVSFMIIITSGLPFPRRVAYVLSPSMMSNVLRDISNFNPLARAARRVTCISAH